MRLPIALLFTAAAGALAAPPAAAQDSARTSVTPYIELDQVAVADLNSGDVLTYAQVSAGVDADVRTARAEGQLSYRYERRIPEGGQVGDDDVHTGLARASYQLARPLSIEAGGVATRTRVDIRGADPLITDTASTDNITQVYSVYAGPTFATTAGPVSLNAAYRFGYTKAETPYSTGLATGVPRQDYFDDSIGHSVSASAGIAPGRGLPVGITLSGGWDREDASQLDQRYDSIGGRGDLLLPVSGTLALTAGAGYQKITVSQRDALLAADGTVVTDAAGRYVTNEASPRRIAYQTDGLIYDAGVVWRPSPRTSLVATVTHEYDSTAFTGAFSWAIDRSLAFNADAYDGIETFGHQLREGLQSLSTSFATQTDSFGQQYNGCIFSSQPGTAGQGAGNCLSDVFQSLTTASYRARGLDAVLSARRGLNSFGIGGGYANRHLFAPSTGSGLNVYGLDNDSWYLQAFYSRKLNGRSQFDANLYGNWFDSALPGSTTVFGAGGTAAYTRSFGRLGATAQLGVYTYDQDGYDDQWNAQALLGARYQF